MHRNRPVTSPLHAALIRNDAFMLVLLLYNSAVQALDGRDERNGADRRFAAEACLRSDDVRVAHDSRYGSLAARELHR